MMGEDAASAACVEFIYEDGSSENTQPFIVPEDLLWSGAGLRELFEVCRRLFLGEDGEKRDEDQWNSWRLKSVRYMEDALVVTGVNWRNAGPPSTRAAGETDDH